MSNVVVKLKNGKIELLRFLFCMAILLFHCQKYFLGEASLKNGLHLALFPHGSIGVEFFFLVSGYLMAKAVYNSKNNTCIAIDTFNFIKRKIKGIFTVHVITFFITLISCLLLLNFNSVVDVIIYIITTIPSFFLIQMSGIFCNSPNHIEWYLSTMFIAMLFLYPILKKNYKLFVFVIGPIISLVILGYLSYTYNSLTGVSVWLGFFYKSLLRAIVEITLGVIIFEVVRNLDKLNLTKFSKILLTLLYLCSIVFVFSFIVVTFPKKYEIYALFFLMVIVMLGFSKQTYGSNFFDNKYIYLLGKMSLPIYLSQVAAINFVNIFISNYSNIYKIFIAILITLIISVFTMLVDKYILKNINIKKIFIID